MQKNLPALPTSQFALGGELYGRNSYERRTPVAFSVENNTLAAVPANITLNSFVRFNLALGIGRKASPTADLRLFCKSRTSRQEEELHSG